MVKNREARAPRRAPPQPPAAAAARPPRRAPPQPPPAARAPRRAPPQPPAAAAARPPRRAPPQPETAARPCRRAPVPARRGPSGRRAPSPAPAAGPEASRLALPAPAPRQGFFGLYQGASNHEELHNLMKATVMIRRLKKDVLSQLPVKRRQQVFLDLSEKDVKNVRALFIELETLKIKIDSSDSKEMIDSLRFAYQNIVNKHQSGAASNHVEGSPASHVGPSPPGPSPGSHAGASHPSQSP
ncbi:uncharacterized protein [Miscanthus floridulus]|uniref:uncharacterized protein n=1 Tax=Miscanthus floridulus TaxID=154761 RepID=UPI0034577B29